MTVTEIIAHLRHLQSVSKPEGSKTNLKMALTMKSVSRLQSDYSQTIMGDIRITQSIFTYSGQWRCNSDFGCNRCFFCFVFGRRVQENSHKHHSPKRLKMCPSCLCARTKKFHALALWSDLCPGAASDGSPWEPSWSRGCVSAGGW